MKRSTRLISVLLVFLFLFNIMLPAAEAVEYDSKGNIVMTDEEAATLLLNYLDTVLAEEGDVIDQSIPLFGGIYLNYTSIDNLYSTLFSTRKKSLPWGLLGDLQSINVNALNGVQRSGGDLNASYTLIQFLQDNIGILQKLARGEKLNFGSADSFIDPVQFNLNEMAIDLIYDELVNGQNKYGNSVRPSSNADTLMNIALQDLIEDEFDFFTPADLAKVDVTTMSVYSIFEDFLGLFFNSLALEPLNTDFKKALANLSGATYDSTTGTVTKGDDDPFYNVIDWNFEFKEDTFVFTDNLIAQFNDILYTIFETVLTADAFASIGLVEGGNENLKANIEKLVRFILPLCPAEFFHGNFDPATADIESISFEEIAALVFRAVIEGTPDVIPSLLESLGIPMDGIEIPQDIQFFPENVTIDTMEKLAVYALHGVAKEILPADYFTATNGYDKNIENAKSDDDLVDVLLDIFMDIVVHYLDEYMPIELPVSQVKIYKAQGWRAEHFLDEIVDWGMSYVAGIFPDIDSAIPAANRVRGKLDSMGAWKKVSIIVNTLMPLEFLNDVSANGFVCDTEKLVKETLLGNFFELDLAAALNVIEPNNNAGNILAMPINKMLLKVVQKILNAILPGTVIEADTNSFNAFFSNASLSAMVGRLIGSLNTRKSTLLPAALPLLGSLMYSDLGGILPEAPDTGKLRFNKPTVQVVDSLGVAHFRIISVFSQADGYELFGLPAKQKLRGKVDSKIEEFGTIIARKSTMASNGWDSLNLEMAKNNGVHVLKSNTMYRNNASTSGDGYYYFAASVNNIKTSEFNENFYAVGYVTYKTASGTDTLYTAGRTYNVTSFR